MVLPLQERGIPAGPKRIIVRHGLNGPIITIRHFRPFFGLFLIQIAILSKFLMPSLLAACEFKETRVKVAKKMGRSQGIRI